MSRSHQQALAQLAHDALGEFPTWTISEIAQRRNTHWLIVLTNGNITRKVFCSATPSDHRAAKNIQRDIRNTVRNAEDPNPSPA